MTRLERFIINAPLGVRVLIVLFAIGCIGFLLGAANPVVEVVEWLTS